MKNDLKTIVGRLLPVFIILLCAIAVAYGQTSTFTYQGRLTDVGAAANGSYDLQFDLYDAAVAGTQIGTTQTVNNVSVSLGIFTVQLDFGSAAFTGADRYLEIRLKKVADPTYTSLSPRQRVTSAPYAVKAQSVPTTAGNNVIAALNDPSTNTTINDSVLPPNLVRTQPGSPQISASGNGLGTDALINLRGTYTSPVIGQSDFKVLNTGGILATGFVRDVGNTTGCAALIPAEGAGTRFMWHPCRGSLRFGRAPIGAGATTWDDANQDDFTFAGGNQVIASDYGAFAYGDQVTVSSTVGVGFGSGITVSGTAGFSAGASNVCSGFACTAIGYTNRAAGQGSVALGYRTEAAADYSVALGYRATTCGSGNLSASTCASPHTGAFIWGDESTTNYVHSQADNEFRIRANGGIRLRVSAIADGNTPGAGGNVGCDLTVAVPSWTCASSRDVKENFKTVRGEDILKKLRKVPVMTFNYINDTTGTRNLGPMAEDFFKAFRLGASDKSINAQNMAGISLAGVQALEERTASLQKENEALRAQLALMETRLNRIERNVKARARNSAKRR